MKWLFWIFALLYAIAFLIYLVGTFGWFGQEQDPLSGIFLIPLGLPWSWLASWAGLSGVIAGILSPAINLAILFALWKRQGA